MTNEGRGRLKGGRRLVTLDGLVQLAQLAQLAVGGKSGKFCQRCLLIMPRLPQPALHTAPP